MTNTMLSAAPNLLTVYVKTGAGRAEMHRLDSDLTRRQRSVLIMVDGRKRLGEIGMALPLAELETIVSALLAGGLIAGPPSAAPAVPADPARLARIKAMMVRSAEAYLGVMAGDVVRRVDKAANEAELKSVLGHWHMAMRESKYGREVAGLHLEEIREHFDAVATI
ncbi:MAG: hypothetical protein ABIT83_08570 [Massilia sp.]